MPSQSKEELVFSLDIGTRTVVGIVGIQEGSSFKVLAADIIEHKSRAMMDGQIHDIGQVAFVAGQIKNRLEEQLGVKLEKVAIAAAGRALKTSRVKIEREIDLTREIDQEMISSLEIEGIQKAQLSLDEELAPDEISQFYCVGYSVINYYLNGYIISNLIGHKGKKIGADLLATFLPHSVIDSLYTVMNSIGLEVSSLTLEPIAAINVTIPKDLRLLNLALVDIGAGTSDIAITRDGSVVAYAMAPVAGDEITERISQHYLVDFNTAERLKMAMSSRKEKVSFQNILGSRQVVASADVKAVAWPAVEMLAGTISEKISECNGKSPNAVFLIGGGSQIPGLTELIANRLGLDRDRVVVRGKDILQNIKFEKSAGKKLTGPECITPVGIAVTACMQRGQDFLSVSINGKKVKLFNSKTLTVADSLILVGFNPGQLIGRTGKTLTFKLNGVKRVIRGEFGKAAEISVNGNTASLETVIAYGDKIEVIPAVDGKNAEGSVSDFIKDMTVGEVSFNGMDVAFGTRILINGRAAEGGSLIEEDDDVTVTGIYTIKGLADAFEMEVSRYFFTVNGNEAKETYILKDKDVITCKPVGEAAEAEAASEAAAASGTPAGASEMPAVSPAADLQTVQPEQLSRESGFTVVVNGKTVALEGGKAQYMFVDIFNYINFDLTRPKGNIVLKLNGNQAGFTDPVRSGDIIEIYWA